jgi:serine protease inhibitor
MRHIFAAFLSVLFAISCAPAEQRTPEPTVETESPAAAPAAAAGVAEGNGDFGVTLYRQLAGEPGNLFVSPVSIAGAFGPVAAGARGETLAAIERAMRFPAGAGLHPALGGLLRDLEREREGATLSVANALWVMEGFPLKPEFARIGQQDYGAAIEHLDFRRGAQAAARINGWVKEETRGRIPTLIDPGSLDGDTALVVTNAVYFLGDWTTPFNASNTREQPFHLPGGATKPIPLMYRKTGFRYFETGSFQAVDLPYKDERLAMSVFLPKAREGLPALEAELTGARLREWLGRLDRETPREVRLHLPKLRIEEDYQLVGPLAAMGMGIAFDPNRADFRAIADADLFISQVVHKTFLRIDEKGTEAAAATGVEVEVVSAPIEPPVVFRADHPFFLVIRDKPSGAILFLGRIVSPEKP